MNAIAEKNTSHIIAEYDCIDLPSDIELVYIYIHSGIGNENYFRETNCATWTN